MGLLASFQFFSFGLRGAAREWMRLLRVSQDSDNQLMLL